VIGHETLLLLCAVSARCFGLLLSLPVGDSIQALPRLLLAVGLGWCLMPIAAPSAAAIAPVSCAWEFVLGLLIGAPLRFVSDAAEMFGELIDSARGQTISAVVDPLNGQTPSDLAAVCRTAAIGLALSLGALDVLVRSLAQSFALFPAGCGLAGVEGADALARWGLAVVGVSLRLSAIFFGAFVMVDLVAGIAARLLKGVQFVTASGIAKAALTFFLLAVLAQAIQQVPQSRLMNALTAPWSIGPNVSSAAGGIGH
jgi:flagellar biosynthesis protein FliR